MRKLLALGAVVIGIRPEDIRWAPGSAEPRNRLEGKVVSSIFLGDQAIAEVEINGQALSVKSMPDNQKPAGPVVIELPADKLVVFPDTQVN